LSWDLTFWLVVQVGLLLDIDVERRFVGEQVVGDVWLRLLVLEQRSACVWE
jgi:hypothetical protein